MSLSPNPVSFIPLCAQLYSTLNMNAPTTVPGINKGQLVEDVAAALYSSKICSYAQVSVGCSAWVWLRGMDVFDWDARCMNTHRTQIRG